jgi:hypothetical protein
MSLPGSGSDLAVPEIPGLCLSNSPEIWGSGLTISPRYPSLVRLTQNKGAGAVCDVSLMVDRRKEWPTYMSGRIMAPGNIRGRPDSVVTTSDSLFSINSMLLWCTDITNGSTVLESSRRLQVTRLNPMFSRRKKAKKKGY